MPASLSPDFLRKMDAYWRAANYLSVGQIYLQVNPLPESPMTRYPKDDSAFHRLAAKRDIRMARHSDIDQLAINTIRMLEVAPPVTNAQGSWGPEEANRLIGPDGPWHNPKPTALRP
jgi:XFP N-terminal domain